MIEHKYKLIVDIFSKMLNKESINWIQNLPIVLWANQSTIRTSTGLLPYYICCRSKLVFPIKLEIST